MQEEETNEHVTTKERKYEAGEQQNPVLALGEHEHKNYTITWNDNKRAQAGEHEHEKEEWNPALALGEHECEKKQHRKWNIETPRISFRRTWMPRALH